VRWVRAAVVLVALAVAAGAIVWVSVFGFRDHKSGVDCGVPLAAAVHAKRVPRIGASGDLRLTNACVGAARARIGIALGIVVVSAAAGIFIVRYRREPA
jgi:hypothetical protein